jgi:hypothetical protein
MDFVWEASIPSGAKEAAEKLGLSGKICGKRPSGAKASIDSIGLMRGLKPPPPSISSFSARCKAVPFQNSRIDEETERPKPRLKKKQDLACA